MSKRILVVGGVAGGASAAARCRRLDENAEIIMFERGPVVSFSNCCLPYHISGIVEQEGTLVLMTPEKFKGQYKIDARVNSNVISVNTEDKTIEVENTITGEVITEAYDALVVSPGADAIVPPLPGLDKIDYYCLKTVPDVSKIMKFVNEKNPKHITRYLMWKKFGFCPPYTTLEERKQMLKKEVSPYSSSRLIVAGRTSRFLR